MAPALRFAGYTKQAVRKRVLLLLEVLLEQLGDVALAHGLGMGDQAS
jgi:hypothetical protein